jgi:hypothetical protein
MANLLRQGNNMTDTAYFIQDRALTLIGDARFPVAYEGAIRWLELAERWAEKRGFTELQETINAAKEKMFENSAKDLVLP